MSMPKLPDSETILTLDQALNSILASIAMEEAALSQILKAESEKIKTVVQGARFGGNADFHKLMRVNESVASVIDRVIDMQILLKNKMRIAAGCLPRRDCHDKHCPGGPCPPKQPCPPHHRPCKPCVSVFSTETRYMWSRCTALRLKDETCCGNGVELSQKGCESRIILPAGKEYLIELDLELVNRSSRPILIVMEQHLGRDVVNSKKYTSDEDRVCFHLTDALIWEAPAGCRDSALLVRLLAPDNLKVCEGEIRVSEIKRNT